MAKEEAALSIAAGLRDRMQQLTSRLQGCVDNLELVASLPGSQAHNQSTEPQQSCNSQLLHLNSRTVGVAAPKVTPRASMAADVPSGSQEWHASHANPLFETDPQRHGSGGSTPRISISGGLGAFHQDAERATHGGEEDGPAPPSMDGSEYAVSETDEQGPADGTGTAIYRGSLASRLSPLSGSGASTPKATAQMNVGAALKQLKQDLSSQVQASLGGAAVPSHGEELRNQYQRAVGDTVQRRLLGRADKFHGVSSQDGSYAESDSGTPTAASTSQRGMLMASDGGGSSMQLGASPTSARSALLQGGSPVTSSSGQRGMAASTTGPSNGPSALTPTGNPRRATLDAQRERHQSPLGPGLSPNASAPQQTSAQGAANSVPDAPGGSAAAAGVGWKFPSTSSPAVSSLPVAGTHAQPAAGGGSSAPSVGFMPPREVLGQAARNVGTGTPEREQPTATDFKPPAPASGPSNNGPPLADPRVLLGSYHTMQPQRAPATMPLRTVETVRLRHHMELKQESPQNGIGFALPPELLAASGPGGAILPGSSALGSPPNMRILQHATTPSFRFGADSSATSTPGVSSGGVAPSMAGGEQPGGSTAGDSEGSQTSPARPPRLLLPTGGFSFGISSRVFSSARRGQEYEPDSDDEGGGSLMAVGLPSAPETLSAAPQSAAQPATTGWQIGAVSEAQSSSYAVVSSPRQPTGEGPTGWRIGAVSDGESSSYAVMPSPRQGPSAAPTGWRIGVVSEAESSAYSVAPSPRQRPAQSDWRTGETPEGDSSSQLDGPSSIKQPDSAPIGWRIGAVSDEESSAYAVAPSPRQHPAPASVGWRIGAVSDEDSSTYALMPSPRQPPTADKAWPGRPAESQPQEDPENSQYRQLATFPTPQSEELPSPGDDRLSVEDAAGDGRGFPEEHEKLPWETSSEEGDDEPPSGGRPMASIGDTHSSSQARPSSALGVAPSAAEPSCLSQFTPVETRMLKSVHEGGSEVAVGVASAQPDSLGVVCKDSPPELGARPSRPAPLAVQDATGNPVGETSSFGSALPVTAGRSQRMSTAEAGPAPAGRQRLSNSGSVSGVSITLTEVDIARCGGMVPALLEVVRDRFRQKGFQNLAQLSAGGLTAAPAAVSGSAHGQEGDAAALAAPASAALSGETLAERILARAGTFKSRREGGVELASALASIQESGGSQSKGRRRFNSEDGIKESLLPVHRVSAPSAGVALNPQALQAHRQASAGEASVAPAASDWTGSPKDLSVSRAVVSDETGQNESNQPQTREAASAAPEAAGTVCERIGALQSTDDAAPGAVLQGSAADGVAACIAKAEQATQTPAPTAHEAGPALATQLSTALTYFLSTTVPLTPASAAIRPALSSAETALALEAPVVRTAADYFRGAASRATINTSSMAVAPPELPAGVSPMKASPFRTPQRPAPPVDDPSASHTRIRMARELMYLNATPGGRVRRHSTASGRISASGTGAASGGGTRSSSAGRRASASGGGGRVVIDDEPVDLETYFTSRTMAYPSRRPSAFASGGLAFSAPAHGSAMRPGTRDANMAWQQPGPVDTRSLTREALARLSHLAPRRNPFDTTDDELEERRRRARPSRSPAGHGQSTLSRQSTGAGQETDGTADIVQSLLAAPRDSLSHGTEAAGGSEQRTSRGTLPRSVATVMADEPGISRASSPATAAAPGDTIPVPPLSLDAIDVSAVAGDAAGVAGPFPSQLPHETYFIQSPRWQTAVPIAALDVMSPSPRRLTGPSQPDSREPTAGPASGSAQTSRLRPGASPGRTSGTPDRLRAWQPAMGEGDSLGTSPDAVSRAGAALRPRSVGHAGRGGSWGPNRRRVAYWADEEAADGAADLDPLDLEAEPSASRGASSVAASTASQRRFVAAARAHKSVSQANSAKRLYVEPLAEDDSASEYDSPNRGAAVHESLDVHARSRVAADATDEEVHAVPSSKSGVPHHSKRQIPRLEVKAVGLDGGDAFRHGVAAAPAHVMPEKPGGPQHEDQLSPGPLTPGGSRVRDSLQRLLDLRAAKSPRAVGGAAAEVRSNPPNPSAQPAAAADALQTSTGGHVFAGRATAAATRGPGARGPSRSSSMAATAGGTTEADVADRNAELRLTRGHRSHLASAGVALQAAPRPSLSLPQHSQVQRRSSSVGSDDAVDADAPPLDPHALLSPKFTQDMAEEEYGWDAATGDNDIDNLTSPRGRRPMPVARARRTPPRPLPPLPYDLEDLPAAALHEDSRSYTRELEQQELEDAMAALAVSAHASALSVSQSESRRQEKEQQEGMPAEEASFGSTAAAQATNSAPAPLPAAASKPVLFRPSALIAPAALQARSASAPGGPGPAAAAVTAVLAAPSASPGARLRAGLHRQAEDAIASPMLPPPPQPLSSRGTAPTATADGAEGPSLTQTVLTSGAFNAALSEILAGLTAPAAAAAAASTVGATIATTAASPARSPTVLRRAMLASPGTGGAVTGGRQGPSARTVTHMEAKLGSGALVRHAVAQTGSSLGGARFTGSPAPSVATEVDGSTGGGSFPGMHGPQSQPSEPDPELRRLLLAAWSRWYLRRGDVGRSSRQSQWAGNGAMSQAEALQAEAEEATAMAARAHLRSLAENYATSESDSWESNHRSSAMEVAADSSRLHMSFTRWLGEARTARRATATSSGHGALRTNIQPPYPSPPRPSTSVSAWASQSVQPAAMQPAHISVSSALAAQPSRWGPSPVPPTATTPPPAPYSLATRHATTAGSTAGILSTGRGVSPVPNASPAGLAVQAAATPTVSRASRVRQLYSHLAGQQSAQQQASRSPQVQQPWSTAALRSSAASNTTPRSVAMTRQGPGLEALLAQHLLDSLDAGSDGVIMAGLELATGGKYTPQRPALGASAASSPVARIQRPVSAGRTGVQQRSGMDDFIGMGDSAATHRLRVGRQFQIEGGGTVEAGRAEYPLTPQPVRIGMEARNSPSVVHYGSSRPASAGRLGRSLGASSSVGAMSSIDAGPLTDNIRAPLPGALNLSFYGVRRV